LSVEFPQGRDLQRWMAWLAVTCLALSGWRDRRNHLNEMGLCLILFLRSNLLIYREFGGLGYDERVVCFGWCMGEAGREFQAYLAAICRDSPFTQGRSSYVPTDLLDRQRPINHSTHSPAQPDFFADFADFDLDLHVQTARQLCAD
jgi:hypothetical protein